MSKFSVPKSTSHASSVPCPNDFAYDRRRRDSLVCDHSFLPAGIDPSTLVDDPSPNLEPRSSIRFRNLKSMSTGKTFKTGATLRSTQTLKSLKTSNTLVLDEDGSVQKTKKGQCFLTENQLKDMPFEGKRIKRAGRCCPQASYNAVWNSANAFQTDVIDKFFGSCDSEEEDEIEDRIYHHRAGSMNPKKVPFRSQTSHLEALDDLKIQLPLKPFADVGAAMSELKASADLFMGNSDYGTTGAERDLTDLGYGLHHTLGDATATLGSGDYTRVHGRNEITRKGTGPMDHRSLRRLNNSSAAPKPVKRTRQTSNQSQQKSSVVHAFMGSNRRGTTQFGHRGTVENIY